MFVRGQLGLGQVDASGITASLTDSLPDAYSDTTTLTGLPVVWELGLAALGGIVLWSLTRRVGGAARKRLKKAL